MGQGFGAPLFHNKRAQYKVQKLWPPHFQKQDYTSKLGLKDLMKSLKGAQRTRATVLPLFGCFLCFQPDSFYENVHIQNYHILTDIHTLHN